jgi:hypothetical protein
MDEFEFPEHRFRSRTFVTPTRNGINQSVIHPMPFSPADENNQDARTTNLSGCLFNAGARRWRQFSFLRSLVQ